jgi:molybdopterin converting factor small subunit
VPVDVEVFGQLSPDVPRRQTMILERATTVHELAVRLGLDPEAVGLIVIDGVQGDMDAAVPPDCRLCFFPPVSGG